MADESFDILRTVFPVVATQPEHAGELARPDFFGTAFAIADGVFMTAGHVAKAAAEHGALTVGGPMSGPEAEAMMGGVRVQQWELWDDVDVALLFCSRVPGLTHLRTWLMSRAQLLTDLSSFGYPHAVTRTNEQDHFEVVFRAYKGHVVTVRGFDRLADKPAVYEMSCAYPLGLSGGPLLLERDGQIAVAGVVLGSQSVCYGDATHTVGIAMTADEIIGLTSETLGGPIGVRLNLDAALFVPKN